MRTQSHFFPAADGHGYDEWDIARLLTLTGDLPVHRVGVDTIAEVDDDYWTDGAPSPRKAAVHMRFVLDVDPSFPIVLGPGGRLVDGMHRVVRALVEGRGELDAVTFDVMPEPDRRNVPLP